MSVDAYRRIWAIAAVMVAVMSLPATATGEPGDGLKAGDVTLVPKLTLSGGYDSNVFRLAEDEYDGFTDDGAAKGSITPALSIISPEDRFFVFTLDSSVTWEQYFGSNETIRSQSGLSTDIGLGASLNSSGNFSLSLDESFERRNEPPPAPRRSAYNRYINRLGAAFGIHPGSRIVEAKLDYEWGRFWHETDELQILDRSEHRFGLNTRYNFLPKTGIYLDASYTLIRYDQETSATPPSATEAVTNVNSQPLRLTAGVGGLITQRLSVKAGMGYGWSFHDEGEQFRGLIGTAAVGYAYGRLDLDNMLQLGYRRSFEDFSLGNFYTDHRMFLNWRQGLAENRLSLNAEVAFSIRDYSFDPETVDGLTRTNGEGFEDQLLSAGAGIDYDITDWWALGADYDLHMNLTDEEFLFGDPTTPAEPSIPVLRRYMQHQVFVSTTLRY